MAYPKNPSGTRNIRATNQQAEFFRRLSGSTKIFRRTPQAINEILVAYFELALDKWECPLSEAELQQAADKKGRGWSRFEALSTDDKRRVLARLHRDLWEQVVSEIS